jgi:hypothetical protein
MLNSHTVLFVSNVKDWTLLRRPNLSGLNSCDGWSGCSTASHAHSTRSGAATWSRREKGEMSLATKHLANTASQAQPTCTNMGDNRHSHKTHWHEMNRATKHLANQVQPTCTLIGEHRRSRATNSHRMNLATRRWVNDTQPTCTNIGEYRQSRTTA